MEFTIKGRAVLADEIDADLLTDRKWYVYKNGNTFYVKCDVESKTAKNKRTTQSLHRVILERMLGRTLKAGEMCDHIDGNGLNNSRSNLRLATASENARNKRKAITNTSGFKGVYFNKPANKWLAQIQINKERIHLGFHATAEDAYQAYCEAAERLFGEFARFN